MSKHLGNILEPIPLMDDHGADALRWFMACSGSPWSSRRIGAGPLNDIARKILSTYWNTASFFSLYASHSDWSPEGADAPEQRPFFDRWILAELNILVRDVDASLENYDTASAGRLLADFIDNLSNWYVRRSRQRFWEGDQNALSTIYRCIHVIARLLAPITPFITEEVWQNVVKPGDELAEDSVHLSDWPKPDGALIDSVLVEQMESTRLLAEVGRAARKNSKVRTRQPLSRALIGLYNERQLPQPLLDHVARELNVKQLIPISQASDVVDVAVKPNFRLLGKRFGKKTQEVADAICATEPRKLVETLRSVGHADVIVAGTRYILEPDEVSIVEVPRSGWVVETQRGVTVALDIEISPELAAEGIARDVVRVVQQARKIVGLDVSDRITLWLTGPVAIEDAVDRHRDFVARETLAVSINFVDDLRHDSGHHEGIVGDGDLVRVEVTKV